MPEHPNPIRICLAGATGWVGRSLAAAIAQADDLQLTSAVSRTQAGRSLGDVLAVPALAGVSIFASVAEALDAAPADVLIDYTKPNIVKQNLLTAIGRSLHGVVGTSGLTDADYSELDALARQAGVGVLAGGNFSMTAQLALRFATIAARFLPSWEIIEYGTPGKPDAPNGTTREWSYHLGRTGQSEVGYPVADTLGEREARGATLNHTQIHSVRLPGFVSSNEVIFGAPGERLRITQDSLSSAEPYVAGTLLAARRVGELRGLERGLGRFLTSE